MASISLFFSQTQLVQGKRYIARMNPGELNGQPSANLRNNNIEIKTYFLAGYRSRSFIWYFPKAVTILDIQCTTALLLQSIELHYISGSRNYFAFLPIKAIIVSFSHM